MSLRTPSCSINSPRSAAALFDFSEKPCIVVHQTLYCFSDKRFRPAALFGSEDGQFGLKIGT